MDWADELATKLWQSPGGNKRLRACIAKALRDVQRETAEVCLTISDDHGQVFLDDEERTGYSHSRQASACSAIAKSICERFGLDKKD